MRKYNENAMFVRLFRITLHVLPPVGQPRKGWITQTFFVYFRHTIAEVLKFDMHLKDNQVSYHNKHIAFRHFDILRRNQTGVANLSLCHRQLSTVSWRVDWSATFPYFCCHWMEVLIKYCINSFLKVDQFIWWKIDQHPFFQFLLTSSQLEFNSGVRTYWPIWAHIK